LIYLHGLLDGLSRNDTGGFDTDTLAGLVAEGSGSINGVTQSVNNATQKFHTDGNVDNGTGTLNNISFLDELVVTYFEKKLFVKTFKILNSTLQVLNL